MITDRDIAALCSGIYAYPGAVPVAWDVYDAGDDDNDIVFGLKKIEGVWVVVFRGSVTVDDWLRDAQALSIWNADLQAHVHPGFNAGMKAAWAKIKTIIGSDPFIIAGHSLGAARAAICTAYAITDGLIPLARIVFGEPKSGFADLAAIVAKAPGRSYENVAAVGHGHDLIPDMPLTLRLQPYTRDGELILLPVTPPDYDGFDEFRFHHMPIYAGACPSTLIH